MIGGSLDIVSERGKGTRISLSVPVQIRRHDELVLHGAGG